MTKCQLVAVLILGTSISACGGEDSLVLDCDADLRFQNREIGKRVVAPEDLDQLEEFAEMPVPAADPAAAAPPAGKCVDMPPAL